MFGPAVKADCEVQIIFESECTCVCVCMEECIYMHEHCQRSVRRCSTGGFKPLLNNLHQLHSPLRARGGKSTDNIDGIVEAHLYFSVTFHFSHKWFLYYFAGIEMPNMETKAVFAFAAAVLACKCVHYKDPSPSIVRRFPPPVIKVSGLTYLSCPLQIRKSCFLLGNYDGQVP